MCCLVALSFFSLAVIVEKHRRFRSAMRESQMFKPVFKNFLRGGEAQELISALPRHGKSHVAHVVSAGILEYDGVRVLVDPTSAEYLAETEIDFVSSLHGGGFKFTNPKASHTCGCGSSFAV